jgi:GNAT superfamily N-acetyltransferase
MTYSRKPMECVADGPIERCTNRNDPEVVSLRAKRDGRTVGRMDLYEGERAGELTVGVIEVEKAHRKQRVGTQLYEGAVREACRRGLALASDSMRSPFAEAFWRKQASKNRALCDGERGDAFYGEEAAFRAPLPQPVIEAGGSAKWPCRRFVVKTPCAVTSLEGGGSRARKRQRKAAARDARVEAAERAENARLKRRRR